MSLTQHVYQPDEDGFGCERCGLPERNRFHATADALATAHRAQRPTHTDPQPVTNAQPIVHADMRSTSIDAAMCMSWIRSTAIKAQVYRCIAFAGGTGLTDDELMQQPPLVGVNVNTARPRRCDLSKEGIIVPLLDAEGQEVTRATRGGSPAIVWVLAEHARAAHTEAMRRLEAA